MGEVRRGDRRCRIRVLRRRCGRGCTRRWVNRSVRDRVWELLIRHGRGQVWIRGGRWEGRGLIVMLLLLLLSLLLLLLLLELELLLLPIDRRAWRNRRHGRFRHRRRVRACTGMSWNLRVALIVVLMSRGCSRLGKRSLRRD